ncbi:MAG: glycine cleavage system aminomethyltransferase GcvT [Candidatus Omnitrophota bacterium]|nr:MAG: glycine cleavage system aminomethyltransferase GcvT [Candidatus Omnitrophota bacterium]
MGQRIIKRTDVKTTFLVSRHKKLSAKLAPFGGWLMPIQYKGIIAEHNWTRNSCSLFDICHMGEFMIYGNPDENNLGTVISTNLKSMGCGMCRYGFLLNEAGGIVDDLIIYKLKIDQWMMVVNAATISADLKYLQTYLSPEAKLENISSATAKLDLQGPLSREVLQDLVGNDINKLKYYTFGYFSLADEKIMISRTGYTGELGYELYISAEKAGLVWDILLADKRVEPAGLGARDTLRLEMAYPLYGQDIDFFHTPEESDLLKFVDFDKDFIGKSSLLKKHHSGVKQSLCCFKVKSRRIPRHNYKIYKDSVEIGVVTSGSFSPSLLCGIGMGYINKEDNKIGQRLLIKQENMEIEAIIIDKPFYKKGSIKN